MPVRCLSRLWPLSHTSSASMTPHLAELLGGIRKAGGDGQADQPRLRICLLVPAGQQSQHPFPDLGIAGAPAGQHLSSDAVALGEQAQQKVLVPM